jgi:catechol 2,3-dioxygenase
MTAIRRLKTEIKVHPDALGVHSLDHFALTVPRLDEAETFYSNFGLDTKAEGGALALRTIGSLHRWGLVTEGGRKKLHHLSFGCYAHDLPRFKSRIEGQGIKLLDPPTGFESNGLWFNSPEGVLIEIKVGPKVMADEKAVASMPVVPEGWQGASSRSNYERTRPRRLSHCLIFTSSVDSSLDFYGRTLGLRLSDRSGDLVAFMHGIHGSDHHLLAFVKSDAPGFHHCSWDVASLDDIGRGAMHMADKGFTKGWGLGRHVLGSNYFHYVTDPWGSHAEYSCDIDYIPKGGEWDARDHDAADSFYLWGPEPPPYFAVNLESPNAPAA